MIKHTQTAGHLQGFHDTWISSFGETWATNIIKQGYIPELPKYFAWKPDPYATVINALLQPWENELWTNPPWFCIPRILAKTIREKASLTILVPFRRSAPWTWVSWCAERSLDPIACNVTNVCEFFVDMLSKDGNSVGSHPDVLRTLQAIYVENPPPTHSDDPIDITSSFDYIRELGENSD
ncbi:hypothetical protein RhiirA4_497293 [Rhizophagus irregularis]|uniref:Uncharacterized protein n=1 Tax=Rhizophagus irregularis TaxID=588596 RepID=A0A2I1H1J6_9GLOM|nr:hypothetical protein RhiirA4_497293 [Rhizophagus irregularis]